jgi:hypothetical protein
MCSCTPDYDCPTCLRRISDTEDGREHGWEPELDRYEGFVLGGEVA